MTPPPLQSASAALTVPTGASHAVSARLSSATGGSQAASADLTSPTGTSQSEPHLPSERPLRIGFGGMSIEASTFSAHTSGFDAFTITTDEAMFARFPFMAAKPLDPIFNTVTFVPLVHGRSLPGGKVEPEVFIHVCDELVAAIEACGPLDGFVLDIHGAMHVIGYQDAEAILTAKVRAALDKANPGRHVPIAATLDLHGNVTVELVALLDMITCYRLAPHEDWPETRERCVANLVTHLQQGTPLPYLAYCKIPVLMPGEKSSTRVSPARELYQEVTELAGKPGVLDASLWVGYAWADEARSYAATVVMADTEAVASATALQIAQHYWDARERFEFVAPTDSLAVVLDDALRDRETVPVGKAAGSGCAGGAAGATRGQEVEPNQPVNTANEENEAGDIHKPYFISDSGDNPTAGGSGDVTWTLTQLLADPRLNSPDCTTTVYVASIFDAAAVEQCFAAGLNAPITVEAGARIDNLHSGPVTISGEIVRLTYGDAVSGRVAVIKVGGIHAIVTERRKPYHRRSDFAHAGLDIFSADIVVVKIGYLEPELYNAAGEWMMAFTPGGVDQDIEHLAYHEITRPLFPFDTDFDPNLHVVLCRAGERLTT